MATSGGTVGRPRNPDIDAAVLAAAIDQLGRHGYDGMSVAAVAEQAGTTRQALYRRWPSKADLATAAIAGMSRAAERPDTDDPFADLVAELAAFRRGVTRPNGISLAGAMLQSGTDPELVRLYRERLVTPRRARIRHILERAQAMRLVPAYAELECAVAAATGTLYALVLAGAEIAPDWPERTARFLWAGVGADPIS